jgi:hypothetical protein
MSEYFFTLSNSNSGSDTEGLHLANEAAARAIAQRLASAIVARGNKSLLSATILITNDAGELVLEHPITTAWGAIQ